MRRHDLLRVTPSAWQAMLRGRPDLDGAPLVADWSARGWPVIVRRRMVGDTLAGIPAALPLPPSHGKRRIGFLLASGRDVTTVPPVLLRDAALSAPEAWQPTIAALLALGDENGLFPRVFGALLWQHVTGLSYLTESSDLDLLWGFHDGAATCALIAGLRRIDAEGTVRIDGELELLDGGSVNWRELVDGEASSGDVLVKTMDGVLMRSSASVFRRPSSVAARRVA